MKRIIGIICIWQIICLCLLIFNAKVSAEEIAIFGGLNESKGITTHAFMVGYRDTLTGNNIGFEIMYLNEGHLEGTTTFHHRDGFAAQISYLCYLDKNLVLRSSMGPYYSFDTTGDGGSKIVHHLGAIASLEGSYYFSKEISGIIRGNFVTSNGSPTASILVGLGYAFGNKPEIKKSDQDGGKKNEISLYVGSSSPNLKEEVKNSLAAIIEAQRNVVEHFDIAALIIEEGDTKLYNRRGIAFEPQLSTKIFDNLTAGIGTGVYFNNVNTSGIITVSAGYEIFPNFKLSLLFARIIDPSDSSNDADIMSVGIGYKF